MREIRSSGSAEGVVSNHDPYSDFRLRSGPDDLSEDTSFFIAKASSEIRNLQRLRTPFVMEWAGIFPSRARRFTVIGEHRRKTATSCAVTNASHSDGFIIRTSAFGREMGMPEVPQRPTTQN